MKIRMKRLLSVLLGLTILLSFACNAVTVRADDTLFEFNGVYTGMSGTGERTNYVVDTLCGTDYILDAVINIGSIESGEGHGVKLILRSCPQAGSGDLELWFGPGGIWACTAGWVGHTDSFDIKPYMGRDLSVRAAVVGDTITLSLDGTEVWRCSDAGFAVCGETNIELGGWDAKYVIKSVKVTKAAGSAGGDPGPGAAELGETGSNTATGDDYYYNNFNGGVYKGMDMAVGAVPFTLDKAYAMNYELEAVLNVKSIAKDDGRGIKIILRENPLADSKDLELWIGPENIWACATSWVGHTAFDFSTYMNRDVTVRVVVEDRMIRMFLDGFEVWSCEDPTFMVGTQTQVAFDGWDAKYQIKSIRLSPINRDDDPTLELNKEYVYPTPQMGGTTYYVDSKAAAGGNGKSANTAWNSIEQVNDHGPFLPGDKILFKRGCMWEGVTLEPQGYGIAGHPIVIDSYGEGALPVIDRKGPWNPGGLNGTSALILKNQSYWTIRNIQVSNQNPVNPGVVEDVVVLADHAEFPMRNGITVRANYIAGNEKNIVKGIVLENVVFANIDGTQGDEGNCYLSRVENKSAWSGGGALCVRAGDMDSGVCRAYIDGITVESCVFRNIGGVGVSTESGWKYYDSFRHVVVRNCRFYNEESYKATFTGMYLVSAEAPLVEYNSIENITNGIGFQVCNNAVAQNNTIVDMDGYLHTMSRFMGSAQYWDGCGIDADCRCKGTTVMLNNYIERCYSGSFGFFDYQDTLDANVVIENNISYNSGRFIYYQCDNASYTFQIRHNTVIRLPNAPYLQDKKIVDVFKTKGRENMFNFVGNVFYYPQQSVQLDNYVGKYQRNAYTGLEAYPTDAYAILGDPMIVLPAAEKDTANISYSGNVAGTTSFCDSGLFAFKEGSPCYYEGDLLCGVDFTLLKGETTETPEPSVVPTNPVGPDPTESTDPPKPTGNGDPTKPTESGDPMESTDGTKPAGGDDADNPGGGAYWGVIVAIVVVILAASGVAVFFILKKKGIIK